MKYFIKLVYFENTENVYMGPYDTLDSLQKAYDLGLVEGKLRFGTGAFGERIMANGDIAVPFEYAFSCLQLNSKQYSTIAGLDTHLRIK